MHNEWSSLGDDYNEDTLECKDRITIRQMLSKAFTVFTANSAYVIN